MGQEAVCEAQFQGKTSTGKALLETDYLLFRGEFLLKIGFAQMSGVEAAEGRLSIRFHEGEAVFALGPAAAKWAEKIRNPKSRIDKLGVKAGQRVAMVGASDESLVAELAGRTEDVSYRRLKKSNDWIFLFAEGVDDLERLEGLQASLKPEGAIWVVYPKGQKHITEAGVMAAAKSAGLVDTKTVAFSATHTGLKVVIPLARRK